MNKKYISTTLPYTTSSGHVGHAFEFVLADVIAEYHRLKLGNENVFFNVGIDEHGQKIYQKAIEAGYKENDIQSFCNEQASNWMEFCAELKINYNNFYRTTDMKHKQSVLRFYNEIKQHTFSKEYEGNYCVGCEAFITDKELINGLCPIHKTEVVPTKEKNLFFDLNKFAPEIKDVLVDKSLSLELSNILSEPFDLSITRQNVKWGVKSENGDVFYVWADAITNYAFSMGLHDDRERFNAFWENSLIICGKDNLKFQAYILQALLLANGIPQTKEVLVHGIILDENGTKMSKTIGNVIDPIEQVHKHGLDAVRYYLVFGLNTFSDSKYSETELINLWNNDIVNGLGNLVARLFHMIDTRGVKLDFHTSDDFADKIFQKRIELNDCLDKYDFKKVRELLNGVISQLNIRITAEKPFAKDCDNYVQIITEIYFELASLVPYYTIILKEHAPAIIKAFEQDKKQKVILFERK